MNKNILIAAAVAIAVVAGGGYYVMQKVLFTGAIGVENQVSPVVEAGKFSGSIADLAARSGSWKCAVDTSTAQAVSSGVVYVAGGKVRADFTTSVPSYGSVETHMLADEFDVYTWSSMLPQGFKTPKTVVGSGSAAPSGQAVDANVEYSYDCQPWSADPALFVVPSSVTFRSM